MKKRLCAVLCAATVFLTIYLRYMAKKEKSSVLEADAMHYSIDLYTNIGILAALFIIKFTCRVFFAPVVESVDTLDLKSNEGQTSYQFKSGLEQTLKPPVWEVFLI